MNSHLFPVKHKFIHCLSLDLIWKFGDFKLLWGLGDLDHL